MRALLAAAILLAAMPVAAHSWYTEQRTPRGGDCCGERDCRALTSDEIRLNDAGELEVLVRGSWWPALDAQYFIGASPDGSWHVCITPNDSRPRCVFGGMGT